MEEWKRTIARGNSYFAQGAWVEAREQYLLALGLAAVLFERHPNAESAVAAWVVSQHNLADLHLQLGQAEAAAEHLCACHERLLVALGDSRLSAQLRQVALQHSGRTYSALLHFIAEHGAYPRTERLLGDLPEASAFRSYH